MEPVHGNANPHDHFQVQANARADAGIHRDQENVSIFPAQTFSGTQNSLSNNTLGLESLLLQSLSESSSGNPYQEPANTISKTFYETHLSSSHQTSPAAEQGHENMVNSNLRADSAAVIGEAGGSNPDKNCSSMPSFSPSSEFSSRNPFLVPVSAETNVIPKHESGSGFGAESSEDDIPVSSMPEHGDGGGHNSAAVVADENSELGTNKGSEIQNPPTQVMERPGDPASPYRIPSHVFARDKSSTLGEWSTASNESLFSIQMGNMSFSRELNWLKSGELGNPGETNMSDSLDALPSNPPPANPTPPADVNPNQNPPTVANLASVNKSSDISPRTGAHDESPGATEAKAAETMREVIRENTENIGTRELSFGEEASLPNRLSHQSDGSTKSFVFPILAGDGNKSHSSRGKHSEQQSPKETPKLGGDGNKSHSSKGVEEKPNQETPNADQPQATKSTKSPLQNRWLSCFACCTFCH